MRTEHKTEKYDAGVYQEVNIPFLIKRKFDKEDLEQLKFIQERIHKVEEVIEPLSVENLLDYLLMREISEAEEVFEHPTVDEYCGGMFQ